MRRQENIVVRAGHPSLWYWMQAVEGARASCLIVHGLGEHSGRYDELAERLTRDHLNVWGLDYCGHGRSEGRRGHCTTPQEILDDIDRVFARMRAAAPQLPLVLFGHSLGGLLVLVYALDHPQALKAVVASSPALDVAHEPPLIKRWLAALLGPILPALGVPNGVHPEWLSHERAVVDAYRRDPLIHHVVSLGGYLGIRRLMARTRARAAELAVPCLILQAGDDRVVSAAASRAFAAHITSPGSALRVYPGFYHEVLNETGREQVLRDLETWLAARLN